MSFPALRLPTTEGPAAYLKRRGLDICDRSTGGTRVVQLIAAWFPI